MIRAEISGDEAQVLPWVFSGEWPGWGQDPGLHGPSSCPSVGIFLALRKVGTALDGIKRKMLNDSYVIQLDHSQGDEGPILLNLIQFISWRSFFIVLCGWSWLYSGWQREDASLCGPRYGFTKMPWLFSERSQGEVHIYTHLEPWCPLINR